MNSPLICMTLTGKTLEEDIKLVKKYQKQTDIVELRVDHLAEEEQLYVKKFPALINLPCILTIRRDVDGGLFTGGEFSRTNLFGRALAFANPDRSKNFAFVDFEEDYHIPSIEDAAMAFGVRIIRSYHNMTEPVPNLKEHCQTMRKTGFEIPKIAFMPHSLSDVLNMFKEGENMTQYEHIFCAMGVEGLPSRLLSAFTNSFLTYVSPEETLGNTAAIGHIDPVTLNDVYHFHSISKNTGLYGITGWPLAKTPGLKILNKGFAEHNIDSVYLPVRTKLVSESLNFCEQVGFRGLCVEHPFKESVLYYLNEQSNDVVQTGSCDTLVRKNNKWTGYNTDCIGFKKALNEFLGFLSLKRKKVAVLGSGGTAKALVYVLKQMGAKVCIFDKVLEHAQFLADKYGFESCQLDPYCAEKLDEYSFLIIQAINTENEKNLADFEEEDPLYFYNFRGNELLFDAASSYFSPVMKRASLAGCKVCNGNKMTEYKACEQFALFTGQNIEV